MTSSAIAVVGMAGRFPGARNVSEFWQNLRNGVESIRDLSDADLIAAGVATEDLANHDYVKRASILDDMRLFDASFFGLSPRDASIMDPQHRNFLECAWTALEDAGHPPQSFASTGKGSIGVFAGSGLNSYLIHNLLRNRRLLESAGLFQLKQTGNDKDVLATRVSYQLDLRGPSINVQTACSTSLVAVHLACQSLLNFECDLALAGGVTIEIPHGLGYVYREGEILSRDGHCRSFDAASNGTVFGSGLGIVVLRRLDDALEDGDSIRAVILGSAINNDGGRKVGYLAPSVEGQAEVIAEALDFAGVNASDISYVEAHGTGTIVGDPIEVRALTKAFRNSTDRIGYCGIGSLKSNVGHLDAAAGIAGLIKTVLSLEHGELLPTLHFRNLNPHIELKNSPFYVNAELKDWPKSGTPRRAGITSLGIGGTNAHVVLEEAPQRHLIRQPKPYRLLTVSAKTEAAADQAFEHLSAHLIAHPETNLADVEFTCHLGRHAFAHRRAVVIEDSPEGIAALAHLDRKHFSSDTAARTAPDVVFMFSGQGSQYINMGRELYENEPVFRDVLNTCARRLREPLGIDLIQALYPREEETYTAAERLNQTWLTQPALFAIEYSLACWWIALGVKPQALVGHSIGEYVAACLAGVFTLEDALDVVALRGRLIFDLPAGSMLVVPLPSMEVSLTGTLSLAAVNNPDQCVISGPTTEIQILEQTLAQKSIASKRLLTSHAFHSAMMDPVLTTFEERLRSITLHPPAIPYLSNVTGTWIKPEEAVDPAYWARHIRSTVRFSNNLSELLLKPDQILLEAGPGNVLASLARQQGGVTAKVSPSLPQAREAVSSLRCALQTLGRIWTQGVDVDWEKLHAPKSAMRIPLPTYAFERREFWIEADKTPRAVVPVSATTELIRGSRDLYFYRRVWKPAPIVSAKMDAGGCWIIFGDSLGLADRIASKLRSEKQDVVLVAAGSSYKQSQRGRYTIRPGVRADYDSMIADAIKNGYWPSKIIHLWSVTGQGADAPIDKTLELSFYSILYLVQALAYQDIANTDLALVSNSMQQVSKEPVMNPARAVLLGPARVIPKELPEITCRSIDIDLEKDKVEDCALQIVAEMVSTRENSTVGLRHGERFVEALETLNLDKANARIRVKQEGVYLITGGLGGLGLVIAEHLARDFHARLVLLGRSALPAESQWESALNDPQESEYNKATIRQLIEIRAVAAGLLVSHADVTDLSQMREAIAEARKRFGRIDGVFHAAGVLDDGPLMTKTADSAARVLDPKVRGTIVLEEVLRKDALSCFVLLSSISSISPPAGQVDYAAANAFLDAFAVSRQGPFTVVNWGLWLDVGMGARSTSPHPWLEQCLLKTDDAVVFAGRFSRARWLLSEHKLRTGLALISGTSLLELGLAAYSRGSLNSAVEYRDVFFLAPITFPGSETKEIRVQLRREKNGSPESGAFRFSIFSPSDPGNTSGWIENATGSIAPCKPGQVRKIDRAAILARCQDEEFKFDDHHRPKQELQFDMGPRWQSLRRISVGKGEALGEVELDAESKSDVSIHLLHPALLDMATGSALYLTENYRNCDDLFLPISYKSIRIYRSLPAKFYSHVRSRHQYNARRDVETFDLTIFDEKGQVLVEVEAFGTRRMTYPPKALGRVEGKMDASQSGGEQLIDISTRPGISPLEGARALTKILSVETGTDVVVVVQPIDEQETRGFIQSARPVAGTAPSNESIESTLTAWWQDLLGVEEVGLEDDFFALGGHSLIGVRLIVKIKKTYRVDLELSMLFEARTVRALADLIRKSTHTLTLESKAWSTLVPIQRGGSRTPLFCIHAVGGDVLFYHQLAKELGHDQPFYAFRSALLSTSEPRDTTVEELASIYLKELRAFYPEGPYLLGGLSFGGLVAYEMAQQLYAQGVEPGLLVLFDTLVPGSTTRVNTTKQLTTLWQNLRKQGIKYLARKAAFKRNYWRMVLVNRAQAVISSFYELIGREISAELRYQQMVALHMRAMMRYEIKNYQGKITLMRAVARNEVLSKQVDPLLGWGKFAAGELEVYDVPSDHEAMLLEPSVHTVAMKLKTILQP